MAQPPDTVLIKITARAGSPQEAQELADAWVAALAGQVEEIEDPSGSNTRTAPQVIPVESAALPTTPVSPNPQRNFALGLVLGLLLGFGYAMIRNVLDRKLRTTESVTGRFPVSVVGLIPTADVLSREKGERAQVALESARAPRDKSSAGEAFRKLRTNLMFMDVDNPPRVIVVTSPRPGDGKSTVALNLSMALAASGEKVVLVDADLRRPAVATALGLVEGAGLTEVLAGRLDLDDALQVHADEPNLSVLAAGRVPPNPSELLGSQAMRVLVEKLSQQAYVILDAAPLLPVTDAAVLSTNADGALIVITAGRTVDHELATALHHVEAVRGRTLGVILNQVPRKGASAYYYSGYYADDYTNRDPNHKAEAKAQKRETKQALRASAKAARLTRRDAADEPTDGVPGEPEQRP